MNKASAMNNAKEQWHHESIYSGSCNYSYAGIPLLPAAELPNLTNGSRAFRSTRVSNNYCENWRLVCSQFFWRLGIPTVDRRTWQMTFSMGHGRLPQMVMR